MTNPKTRTASSLLLSAAVFLMTVMIGSLPVLAQSGSSEARAQKSEGQAKKARPAAGKPGKRAGAKSKAPVRDTAKTAEPAAEAAAPSVQADEKVSVTPPAASSERLDFDTDADDAQKMEPGLELIQAAPRRARHRSLVPASPSPEDSVVNRP
jgi:hypothetical protein